MAVHLEVEADVCVFEGCVFKILRGSCFVTKILKLCEIEAGCVRLFLCRAVCVTS